MLPTTPQGAVSFQVTADDAAGDTVVLSTTADGSHVVVGTTAPVITVTSSPTQPVQANSAAGAAVSFAANATDVVDGTDPVIFTENGQVVTSGSTFALGAHEVVATATDQAGNFANQDLDFSVVDTPPSIAGTDTGQTPTDEASLTPFAAVTLSGPANGPQDSLTITVEMPKASQPMTTACSAPAPRRQETRR